MDSEIISSPMILNCDDSTSSEECCDGDDILETEWQENAWTIIAGFFQERGLVEHQLKSFDNFLNISLKEIIANTPPIVIRSDTTKSRLRAGKSEIEHTIKFGDPFLTQPNHYVLDNYFITTPNEARTRGLTYCSDLLLNVEETINGPEKGTDRVINHEKLNICCIPIMVRSSLCVLANSDRVSLTKAGECPMDPGGYFIIGGSEKVIVSQERMATNAVFVFTSKQDKYSHVCEIRSLPTNPYLPVSKFSVALLKSEGLSQNMGVKHKPIRAVIPSFRQDVPIFVLFRAFGRCTDRDILGHIIYDQTDIELMEMLKPSLEDSGGFQDESSALRLIASCSGTNWNLDEKSAAKIQTTLKREVFPHLSNESSWKSERSYFLGYMVHRLLSVALGRRNSDDRDHLGNKRLDTVGFLMAELYRTLFRRFCSELRKFGMLRLNKGKMFDLNVSCRKDTISHGLRYSLSTGNWGDPRRISQSRCGVSQVLNRFNYVSTLSHLRRICVPIGRDSKVSAPRQLHNTQWGMYCPCETPEGQCVGLIKNLALMASVSGCSNLDQMRRIMDYELDVNLLSDEHLFKIGNYTKVFVDGHFVGLHKDGTGLVQRLRALRFQSILQRRDTSIMHNAADKEIWVNGDGGRICRPLLVVRNNKLKIRKEDVELMREAKVGRSPLKWSDLLTRRAVEYVDALEEENCMIAMTPSDLLRIRPSSVSLFGGTFSCDYTHCEVHPSMMLGLCASLIPFVHHNQSPRNTYQSGMCKQAIGIYSSNFNVRTDPVSHCMFYPQKPLSCTMPAHLLELNELPAGANAIVAIACYTGYNQEDSVIMNSSSLDRGLFRTLLWRTYVGKESTVSDVQERIRVPRQGEINIRMLSANRHLDSDGIVRPGAQVCKGDVLIGKQRTRTRDETHHDERVASHHMKWGEAGVVDQVLVTADPSDERMVRVKVRSVRKPQIGDKFASRHGQKGTVGMMYRMEDMPFTVEGICPDLILNPHAIPSRMTIGHLIECLQSKAAALSGVTGDATAFNDKFAVEDIGNVVKQHKYHRYGNEVMYNGFTGRKIASTIFIGPTYYQRLKHMVEDKIHARSRGPVQCLNRQPMEGRSRDGGLRFGEMERDCQIAHGAALFLRERLFTLSDPFTVYICHTCGLMAFAQQKLGIYWCKFCSNATTISPVEIPYACKLLFQELMTMNITPRLVLG